VEEGIGVLQQARELWQAHPSIFVRAEFFEFYLADAFSSFGHPRWAETRSINERFLEKAQESALTASPGTISASPTGRPAPAIEPRTPPRRPWRSWNSGAAQTNKIYADFCLEMQKSGVMAKN